jgi:hypothetical protein
MWNSYFPKEYWDMREEDLFNVICTRCNIRFGAHSSEGCPDELGAFSAPPLKTPKGNRKIK